jgi:hypothetical protein
MYRQRLDRSTEFCGLDHVIFLEERSMSDSEASKPPTGDLTGVGEVINSQVAKWTYQDGLSSSVKQVGALSTDTLKTLRLFAAPFQLLAAYQDRLELFCNRVRERVPESEQKDATPEIARPVMEAFASTSDNSTMMQMFEELMAKAIDKRESDRLSPEFPEIIRSLSPLEALLITRLRKAEQYTDDLFEPKKNLIVGRVGANFDFTEFGGQDLHLTLIQHLEKKNLVTILQNQPIPEGNYPNLKIADGLELKRMLVRLTMYGIWFANSVSPRP